MKDINFAYQPNYDKDIANELRKFIEQNKSNDREFLEIIRDALEYAGLEEVSSEFEKKFLK